MPASLSGSAGHPETSRSWPRTRPGDAAPIAIVAPVSADLPSDFFNRPLAEVDPEIAEVLALELERQQNTLEMIASENFVPVSVLDGSLQVLTHRYAAR